MKRVTVVGTFNDYAKAKEKGLDVQIMELIWVGANGTRKELWERVPGKPPVKTGKDEDGGTDE